MLRRATGVAIAVTVFVSSLVLSSSAGATTASVPPTPPAVTTLSSYHQLRVIVSNGLSTGLLGATFYRGSTPENVTMLAQVPIGRGTTFFDDTTGVPGASYYYAATLTNSSGESGMSPLTVASSDPSALFYVTDAYAPAPFVETRVARMSDAGKRTQVTSDTGEQREVAVSPDGSRIAYSSNHAAGTGTPTYDIWTADARTGVPTRLTANGTGVQDHTPQWSPDGQSIAFVRTDSTGHNAAWIIAADGSTSRKLGDELLFPTWAPSGRLLAAAVGSSNPTIAVVSADGSYRRAVADQAGAAYDGFDPAWSPDGTKLSFLRFVDGSPRLVVVPPGGGAPLVLTDSTVHPTDQSWSPDGSRIYFTSVINNHRSLRSVAADGSAPSVAVVDEPSLNYESPSAAGIRAAYVSSPPAKVAGVSAALGNGSVTLKWSAPSGGASYYMVRRSAAGASAPQSPEEGAKAYTGTGTSVTVSGLKNGSAYSFSVFAMNYRGDASAPVSRGARPAATPVVSPNGSVLGSLVGNGPKFTAKWGATLNPGQVYDVQIGSRSFSNGKWSGVNWSSLVSGTTAGSREVSPTAGKTYYLRARVRDGSGNVTAWSGASVAPVPYDDRALAVSGTWAAQTSQSGRFLGTIRATKSPGAKLSYSTYGTKFSVVADKCTTCGQVKIYVDGALKATVDTKASSTLVKQVIWNSGTYTLAAKHTVMLVAVGTAGHPQVRIDALIARR